MYELIVNFEIPYYVLELQVNTFILFCTVLRWLLIQPKHVAIDIVYKIWYVDGLFVGSIDWKHNGDESLQNIYSSRFIQ